MDYTRNEDYYGTRNASEGVAFNAVLDCLFVEDSSPVTEPVTVAEAMAQANIDNIGGDDTLIEAYITTARMQCENYTGIGFIEREVIAVVNNSLGNIFLPYGPVASITSVYDLNDNEITADEYKVSGVKWTQFRYPAAAWLKITYVAGYNELPQLLKTALLQQVAYLYEHRGDEDKNTFSPIAKSLLQPIRRV